MTLDPVSVALGFVAAYVFSCVAFIALCVVESREGKKRQGRALDQALANVAVASLEQPTNVRTN